MIDHGMRTEKLVTEQPGQQSSMTGEPGVAQVERPGICRAVHYVSYGTPGGEYGRRCRAATITEVGGWETLSEELDDAGGRTRRTLMQEWDPDAMSLAVDNPTGCFYNTSVPYHPGELDTTDPHLCTELEHPGGTWHWPARR